MDTTQDDEIEAMKNIYSILKPLDSEAQSRVFMYISSRIGIHPTVTKVQKDNGTPEPDTKGNKTNVSVEDFDTSSEFLSKLGVSSDAEKALTVAIFLHKKMGCKELTSQQINKELFNMGLKIGNITRAMNSLMEGKPQLMVQLKKKGNTKQGRKEYKVTTAGFEWADSKLNSIPSKEATSIDA